MSSVTKNTTNTGAFSSTSALYVPEGYIFRGNTYEQSNSIPAEQKFYETSARDGSGGTRYRDLFYCNAIGPIRYNETSDDRQQIVNLFADRVARNAILSYFPYLNPLPILNDWSNQSQNRLVESVVADEKAIYKCLGKGLGEITIARVARAVNGQPEAVGRVVEFHTNGTVDSIPKSPNAVGPLYQYDGYIYAGTLVQIRMQPTEDDPSISELVIVPYQNGRGIPYYARNYCPDLMNVLEYAPYGELRWESANETMHPDIAPGIDPGDCNACLGIVLDTFTSPLNKQTNPLYDYNRNTPEGFDKPTLDADPHDHYTHHPAPHVAPAVSVIANETNEYTQGFLSPGPNSSGTYFAPWPRYYAYQPGDPVPVLTRGITTARIGAAYNIALMFYGINASTEDPRYLAVPCIPLFQGETLHTGSIIYAAVKGNIMTAGPYQDVEFDPGRENATTVFGVVGQHPWDHFVDSTYGNYGWTGTPGLSFYNIPDHGVALPEVAMDSERNVEYLPYLNQANQGSIIVHPITTTSVSPSLGNNYLQTRIELELNGLSESQAEEIREERAQLPNLSGRTTLPQEVPAKSYPIGTLLETIHGTGRWTYTGLPIASENTASFNVFTALVTGGAVYGDPLLALTSIPLRDGTGTGMEGTWSEFNEYAPYLGTITGGITQTAAGVGYADGDILTFQDDTLTYNPDPMYKANNAAVEFTGPSTLALHATGSGYTTTLDVKCWNLSVHSVYYRFASNGTVSISAGGIPNPNIYFQDVSNFVAEVYIRIVDASVNYMDSAYAQVVRPPSTTDFFLDLVEPGSGYPVLADCVFETEIQNHRHAPPRVNIVASGGELTGVTIRDFGCGNRVGDRILIVAGDQNAVFEYKGLPDGYQEIITSAGPSYYREESSGGPIRTYECVLAGVGTNPGTIFEVYSDLYWFTPDSGALALPVIFRPDATVPGAPGVFNLQALRPATQIHPDPWYHGNCCAVEYTASGDWVPRRGGSGYTTANHVSCYNLSANSLRIFYQVDNAFLTGPVTGASNVAFYEENNFEFLQDRYTFDPILGTQVRILNTFTEDHLQEIVRLDSYDTTDGLTTSLVRSGGRYVTAPTGDVVFQTQRLDQENPTVDIVATFGQIDTIKLRTAGINNQEGDLILVTQEGSGFNAIFLFHNNMPKIDLPPYAQDREGYAVDRTTAAWDRYSQVMQSATNLFDRQVLIELNPNTCEHPMDNILPYGYVGGGTEQPATGNVYRDEYVL